MTSDIILMFLYAAGAGCLTALALDKDALDVDTIGFGLGALVCLLMATVHAIALFHLFDRPYGN